MCGGGGGVVEREKERLFPVPRAVLAIQSGEQGRRGPSPQRA